MSEALAEASQYIEQHWPCVEIVASNLIAHHRLDATEIYDCLRKIAAGRRLLGEFEQSKETTNRSEPTKNGTKIFDPVGGVMVGLVAPNLGGGFVAVGRDGHELGVYGSHNEAERMVQHSASMRWRCDGMRGL